VTPASPGTDGLALRASNALSAYRSGDPSMMSRFVDEATPLLWHVARHQGLDDNSAQDVVQTAWMRLIEHAESISDSQAVLKWLITTTRREAWRVARQGRRVDVVDDIESGLPPTEAADPGPEEAVVLAERQSIVWRHFRRLPERCRELLQAVAFTDRPDYAAVAEALGMPIGSIGPTRGRCLAKLRVLLDNDPTWKGS
jgi:RNA polymerase sigma factor (sigma-70 family)